MISLIQQVQNQSPFGICQANDLETIVERNPSASKPGKGLLIGPVFNNLLLCHQPLQFSFVILDNFAGNINDHLVYFASEAEWSLVYLWIHGIKSRITSTGAQDPKHVWRRMGDL